MSAEPTIGGSFRAKERIASRVDPRARSTRRRVSLWSTALIALAGVSWLVFRPADGARTAASAVKEAPPIPVGVAIAARGDFRVTLAALGTVTPLATVSVKTQIAGRLTQIGFEEGQMVEEGDFLAEIDPRRYQARSSAGAGPTHPRQGPARERPPRSGALRSSRPAEFDLAPAARHAGLSGPPI